MQYVVSIFISFIILVWYIRPLYNFFVIRKYSIHNHEANSLFSKIKTGLPAILFYTLLMCLFFYPVITNELINTIQSSSIFVAEVIFIFIFTRVDKSQTKYVVSSTGVRYHWKEIKWDSKPTIKFKKSAIIVLHKPRFILSDGSKKIVIPILSKNIEVFLKAYTKHNRVQGEKANTIYLNTISYYVSNKIISKELNKND